MKIRWTRLALADLAHALEYISEKRSSSPSVMLPRIEKALDALGDHPYIGRPGRVAGTRELLIVGTPFMFPYRIKAKTIELLAFIHGARRWPDSF